LTWSYARTVSTPVTVLITMASAPRAAQRAQLTQHDDAIHFGEEVVERRTQPTTVRSAPPNARPSFARSPRKAARASTASLSGGLHRVIAARLSNVIQQTVEIPSACWMRTL
jgi:hypothetical protein